MLDVLCQVTNAVWDRNTGPVDEKEYPIRLRNLELRIQRLEQRLTNVDDVDSPSKLDNDVRRPTQMAELYRLATLIYLDRVARGTPRSHERVAALLDAAYHLLREMGTCERPWPLFVIALDARSEEERKLVLDVMGTVLRDRLRGNMLHARRMVQAGWVQQDFAEQDVDQLFVYNAVISASKLPPSFT